MKKPYSYYNVGVRFHKKDNSRIVFYSIEGTLTFVLSELRRLKKLEQMDKYVITDMYPFESMQVVHKSTHLNEMRAR